MASSYPGALDSFTAKADDQDDVQASHVNDLQDAVVAVETALGANPAGGLASVVNWWKKGADIASATALALGTDGSYFDVTGTTTITSINTLGIGSRIKLHFDGILTLTHHATDLILPGAANITTAAGDEAEFVEYATGDWRCVNYQEARRPALNIIARPAAAVSTANNASEITIKSVSVPANALGTDGVLRFRAAGVFTNNTGVNRTITFLVKFGGTTVGTLALSLAASATSRRFVVEGTIMNAGSAAAQVCEAHVRMSDAVADAANSNVDARMSAHSSLAINTAVAQTFAITGQLSIADANLSFVHHGALVEVI